VRPLVVVGDVLLDVDIETSAERLSPDGPVPVLDEQDREVRAGGAALAARLATCEYDGPVVLVTPLADDEAGASLRRLLDPRVRLIALPAIGETPVKTRLRCGNVTVARLDRGTVGARPSEVSDEGRQAIENAGAVLVSDYGTGASADPALRDLVAAAANRVAVLWDPHPRGAAPVPGAALVTPNAKEAARAVGGAADGDLAVVRRQAEELLRRWRPRSVAVTIGRRGALLVDSGGRGTVFPPPVDVSGDACGAGDCFAAAATAALLDHALPSEAVQRGVARATEFLAAGGVAGLDRGPRPVTDLSAERLAAGVRARGQTVVATGGCFDLLHAGHVTMLAAARSLGDCLIVCLNSDDSVRRLKGNARPLQPAEDRARLLRALRAVDAVTVFEEDTPVEALRRLRPHLWVKGDDYAGARLPETDLVRSWGGEVVTVPYLAGRSTSSLVELSRQ
jgi:D-beta-D-heptose 7-phosphate kinase / D-beta-D-heptose 1-phosphate adenosyltransferase